MEELLSAIYDVYDGDSDLKAAVPGDLRRETAKREGGNPYGRYFVVSAVPTVTAGSQYESIVIQFDIFYDAHNTRDARIIWDCYAKLIAAFPMRHRIAKTSKTYVFWFIFAQAREEEEEVHHLIVQYRVIATPN